MPRRHIRTAAVLAAIGFALTACGGDNDPESDASSTTPTTSVESTTAPPTTAPVPPAPRYMMELQQLTGENVFARVVYGCPTCTIEQFAAITAPEGWVKTGPMLVVPETALTTPDVDGAPLAMDFVAEIPGSEFLLWARAVSGTVLGVNDEGPMALTEVERTTSFTYRAGSVLHEVIDTDGNRYALFTVGTKLLDAGVDPATEDAFAGILLPEGWSYESRTLDADLAVESGGLAHVFSKPEHTLWQRYEA